MLEKFQLRLVKRWGALNVLLFYVAIFYILIVGYGFLRTWIDS